MLEINVQASVKHRVPNRNRLDKTITYAAVVYTCVIISVLWEFIDCSPHIIIRPRKSIGILYRPLLDQTFNFAIYME